MGRNPSASTVAKSKDKVFAAAVIHSGLPDFDGTTNMKIHLHIEY